MVPDRKTSKAVKRARRSHQALRALNLARCPKCGKMRLPHRACANCGYFNGRVAIPIETEEG